MARRVRALLQFQENDVKTPYEGGSVARLWAEGRSWSNGRRIALAVIVAGVIVPLTLSIIAPSTSQLVVEAVGSTLLAAGLVLLVTRECGELRRHVESLAAEVRAFAEGLERCSSGVDTVNDEVAALGKTVDGERRNLGMVAEGLGEMRQIVRMERQNLGLVASAIEDTKDALQGIATKQVEVRGEIQLERHNLGLVAGALDNLRRLTAGVNLFDARQAAFEDTLIQIADRVDRISGDTTSSLDGGQTMDVRQHPTASAHDA